MPPREDADLPDNLGILGQMDHVDRITVPGHAGPSADPRLLRVDQDRQLRLVVAGPFRAENLDPDGGQRWVVYDEAWRLMSHPALLRRMDAHWRLARHYGIANMLVIHRLSDLDNVGDTGSAQRSLAAALLANAETRVIYRQETDQLGTTAKALNLTRTEATLLPTFGLGQGLWRIRKRSFLVQAQLHPAEAQLFETGSKAAGRT